MDSTDGAGWPAAPNTTCGTSGNTYWGWPVTGVPGMALDGSHIYVAAGSRISPGFLEGHDGIARELTRASA